MTKISSGWRGLIQLFAVTVLPLSILILLVVVGSVAWHEQDMRALVEERDERAVQSAAAAFESELHHRAATISMLAYMPDENSINPDLLADFDGGLAYFDAQGNLIRSTKNNPIWNDITHEQTAEAVFSPPVFDSSTQQYYVVVSIYSEMQKKIIAGAFTPASLASKILSATYPAHSQATIFLLDSSRRILFVSGALAHESLPANHPGVAEALRGESGTQYVKSGSMEHVIAYSPISPLGWAIITEEEWQHVSSPSLQATQFAPLVFVPVFLLALLALWFGARQVIQPLQKLEAKAITLASGDFESIHESVGGIAEIQRLQSEMAEMARKVQSAQAGLHDYIGAITSAQEEERLRLARELHDETIQAVIALKQRIQLAQKSIKDQHGTRTLQELETLSEETVENLRRIIRALRPIYLEDLGLVAALEMLARETKAVQVNFQPNGHVQRLNPKEELALYRIAQEALSNVTRHAHASGVNLNIYFGDSEIKLEVVDNGAGFNVPASATDLAASGHFGLLGMKERAELIGGKFEVTSRIGSGTSISIRLLPNVLERNK